MYHPFHVTRVAAHFEPSSAVAESALLRVDNLAVSYPGRNGDASPRHFAVNGVSLRVYPRQTVAVVGESGCGKSMTALSIMRLIPQVGYIDRGEIFLHDRDLLKLTPRQMRAVRGREIAMIFQEPMTSLNPVFTVGEQIIEAVTTHQDISRSDAAALAVNAMHEVGIPNPSARLRDYPHQFSGGMRQRVMIAMALACQPKLLLADEPTTALDVTIQAQVLALLRRLQHERSMGMLLITHDLGVVANHADVVCVMYAGRVVEYASVFELFQRPLHPYTRGLLRCKPGLRERRQRLETVAELVNDPREFQMLPGAERDVIPWWPHHAYSGVSPLRRRGADECALREAMPGHWVSCWCTDYVAANPSRTPDLDERRS